MYTLPFLHFSVFLADMGLIVLLLCKNSRALLNRTCSLLIAAFAIWSFGYCYLDLSQSYRTAWLWMRIASIGWCIFPAATLYFALALTNKDRLLKSKLLLAAVVAATAFFLYQIWAGKIVERVVQNSKLVVWNLG